MTKFHPFGILAHFYKKPLISIKYLPTVVSLIGFSSFNDWRRSLTKIIFYFDELSATM